MLVDVDSSLVPLHLGSVIVLALVAQWLTCARLRTRFSLGVLPNYNGKGSVGVPQVEDGCHYSTRISIYCKTNIHLTRIVPRLRLYLCIHIIYTHVVRQGNHFWKVPFWTLN